MSVRAFMGVAALVGAAFSSSTVAAQEAALMLPKPVTAPDRNGVDVTSGTFSDSPTVISVGPVGSGLVFRPTMTDRARWTHNFLGGIVSVCAVNFYTDQCEWSDGTGTYLTVTTGEGSATIFVTNADGTYSPVSHVSSSLVKSGDTWTYTAHDGTVATFSAPAIFDWNGDESMSMRQISLASLRTMQKPNGVKYTYDYSNAGGEPYRLTSVTTNTGYQIFLESTSPSQLTKVTAVNAGTESCPVNASSCTLSGTWPTLTFGYPAGGRTLTDSLGRTTFYSVGVPPTNGWVRVLGVRRPGRASGYDMTFNYRRYVSDPSKGDFPYVEHYGPVTSVTTDAGQWTYRNTYGSDLREVTDPAGNKWSYLSFSFTGREFVPLGSYLAEITDPLLNKISNGYAYSLNWGPALDAVVQPEGNKTTYAYDARGNVTEVRQVSKTPGTPADVVQSATYATSCSSTLTCNLPLTTTDARGGVTDYTYDAAGNLLTVTGPAPTPGAARPRTVYTWEQRYAWYKQNGSSAISQASSPVWVMTSQYSCMTGATC